MEKKVPLQEVEDYYISLGFKRGETSDRLFYRFVIFEDYYFEIEPEQMGETVQEAQQVIDIVQKQAIDFGRVDEGFTFTKK